MSEQNGITYQILQKPDLEQTINCLVDVFSSAEPIIKALQITPTELYPFAKIVCQKAVENGLSLIAKDPATSKVVGFIISEDLSEDLSKKSPEEINKNILQDQKLDIVFKLLKELNEQYEKQKKSFIGKMFHIYFLGIIEKYRGRRISNNLVEKNLNMAIEKGFLVAKVEATGNISQHIFRKYGFEDRYSIDYQTYEYKGRKILQGIKKHKSLILMDKVLIPNPLC